MKKHVLVAGCAAMFALAALPGCVNAPPSASNMYSRSGPDLYETLCASCHGVQGHGDGPVAPSMKVRVPDLTLLAYRDGGEFPAEDIRRVIDGRFDRRAHGPRDMPVWGWQFYDMSSSDDATERARVDALIERMVTYLRSIQREAP